MEHLLQNVIGLARRAGAMIRDEFYHPDGPRGYGGKAPIDVEVEQFLRTELERLTPGWGIQGEELPDQPGVTDLEHCWVLDPQDGTSAFLRGFRGSSVAIGLLHKGEPVLGVVYAPLYPNDRGDLIAGAKGVGLFRDGVRIQPPLPDHPLEAGDIVIVSQDADRRVEANLGTLFPARYLPLPSIAYRLALAAAGEVRAGMSVAPLRTLDICASHALLRLSGRLLRNLGHPEDALVRYDGESNFHGAIGADPAALECLTPWPWGKIFGPAEDSPLARPKSGRGLPPQSGWSLTRAQGCLLGQIAGDSLGSLVEFKSADEIARLYPTGPRELADGGVWNTLAGQPTDDSEMALALARCLLESGGFDSRRVLDAYKSWLDSGPFDLGNTIRWGLTGTPDLDSQANGSLMRSAPLGLAFEPEQLDSIAVQDSRLTHPHPNCNECCRLFTKTISRGILGLSPQEAVDEALAEAQGEPKLWLEQAVNSTAIEFEKKIGWVRIAFTNAFGHLAAQTPLDEAVVETVRRGGDTDTNAAIVGALLGAFQGLEAVPLQWRLSVLTCRPHPSAYRAHKVRPKHYWPVDALILAERLLHLRHQIHIGEKAGNENRPL